MGMKNSETQVKTVLGDTIVALCRSMLSQHAHVHVEGLLGITLNSEEIFLVNISRSISNVMEGAQKMGEEVAEGAEGEKGKRKSPRLRKKKRKRLALKEEEGSEEDQSEQDGSEQSDNSTSDEDLVNDSDQKDINLEELGDAHAMFESYCVASEDAGQRDQTDGQTDSKINCPTNMKTDKDCIRVKTEVVSDDDLDTSPSSIPSDSSLTPNLPWPLAFSQGFVAPSMRLPTVHLPNITNMLLGENTCTNETGGPVSPGWFCGSTKESSVPSSKNTPPSTPRKASMPSNHGDGLRRWTRRRRGPEAIVDVMLAQQNMMNSKTCPLCGRTFGEAWIMRRHMMVHTGAKAYQCHLCAKKFTRKDVLSAHMKVHWPKKNEQFCDDDDQTEQMSLTQAFPWNGSTNNSQHSTTLSDVVATTSHSSIFDSGLSSGVAALSTLSKALPESSEVSVSTISEAAMKYAASNHLLSPSVAQSLMGQGTPLGNVQLG